ncbi:MAG: ABC transporter ATP-binding protein [Spirochaetia bacterium]|jgi:peptide/nickel transport system ATP-binding protein/oligopeptide transport system ATP-binding protein|nr:ABC transporter ATP-binding protein [Spirochaetia bacterium]
MTAALEVKNLSTRFHMVSHTVRAVDDVSFTLGENEILAIAGESGSGKSAAILSLLRLIPPPGEIDPESRVFFEGRDILGIGEKQMNGLRGKRISMIFQEPSASFNPLFTVGSQIAEVLRVHLGLSKAESARRAGEALAQVRIPNAQKRVRDFPFQLSGGMLQRSMIALALACGPRILLADEPTTALDPTTSLRILELLKEKTQGAGMSMIFVTHDLELLSGFADRIMVMYAGRIFESGPAGLMLERPLHPYTQDLLAAIPRPGVFKDSGRLYSIQGRVPAAGSRPSGCAYHPRCRLASPRCAQEEPDLVQKENSFVRCRLYV